MRFAHLSDLHLSQVPVVGVSPDADAIVEHMVRDVCRIRDVLDFVVVSGDLTDDAHPASFQRVEGLLAQIDLPVFVIPGNHDGPEGYYQYCTQSDRFAAWDISNRVVQQSGLRLIGIDTCIEGETTGRIESAALSMIEQEIARDDPAQLIIVMHHPLILPGMRDFDAVAQLDHCDKMLGVIQLAGKAQIILAGHIHRPYCGHHGGATCFVAGSPSSAFTSDLPFGDSPIRFDGLQDFYHVHEITANGRHVVTPQHFSYAPRKG